MSQLTKRMQSAQQVHQLEKLFRCPICNNSMQVVELQRIRCTNNHSFDFAKQGYLNLLSQAHHTKYDKELFEARKHVITEGQFFDPLTNKLSAIIRDNKNAGLILDAGCGEGSHLAQICEFLNSRNQSYKGLGVDIAKEGIQAAAKNYQGQIWCVADLANLPIQNQGVEFIINILSPSNYREFHRVLHKEGLIIKVVPQREYLIELRKAFMDQSEKQIYSNEDVVKHFTDNFDLVERENLRYEVNLNVDILTSLVKMTPLTWSASQEKLNHFLKQSTGSITVDLDILIGEA